MVQRIADAIYGFIVRLHTLSLSKRVKTTGSVIYLAGAVAGAIWRQQLRSLMQFAWWVQVKSVLLAVASNITQVFQQAQGFFH